MNLQEKLVDSAISALYEAASSDDHWPLALASVLRAFDSPRVALMRTTPTLDGFFEFRQLNHDQETERLYRDYYWSIDPTIVATRQLQPAEWLDCNSQLDPRTTPSPEYADFAARNGFRHVAGGKVRVEAESCTILSVQRPADHRPFDAGEDEVFRRLAPHIGRASSLSTDLRTAELAKGLSLAALNALEWPVFAVTSSGKLLLANAAAESLLALGTPFTSRHGILLSRSPDVEARLQEAMRIAANRQGSSLRIAEGATAWWMRALPVAGFAGVVLIYLSKAAGYLPSPGVLRSLYKLSLAEAEVALLLVAGHNVKQIADARSVSVLTVRSQVRDILRKTGVRRQADLAQLLLTLPPLSPLSPHARH